MCWLCGIKPSFRVKPVLGKLKCNIGAAFYSNFLISSYGAIPTDNTRSAMDLPFLVGITPLCAQDQDLQNVEFEEIHSRCNLFLCLA